MNILFKYGLHGWRGYREWNACLVSRYCGSNPSTPDGHLGTGMSDP